MPPMIGGMRAFRTASVKVARASSGPSVSGGRRHEGAASDAGGGDAEGSSGSEDASSEAMNPNATSGAASEGGESEDDAGDDDDDTNDAIHLCVCAKVHEGKTAEFLEHTARSGELSRAEEGVLSFVTAYREDDPNEVCDTLVVDPAPTSFRTSRVRQCSLCLRGVAHLRSSASLLFFHERSHIIVCISARLLFSRSSAS